jgi:hypothetical protein
MEIEKDTDPGVIKLKMRQEIQALRDARREERLEFMEESQRANKAYNDLALKHNEMVVTAANAIKLAATLGSCLAGAATFALLLVVTAWLEGTVPLRAGVMGLMVGGGIGAIMHTLLSDALWREENEE